MIRIAIEIAEEARKIHQDYSNLNYMAAIREAKQIFLGAPIRKATKEPDQSIPR